MPSARIQEKKHRTFIPFEQHVRTTIQIKQCKHPHEIQPNTHTIHYHNPSTNATKNHLNLNGRRTRASISIITNIQQQPRRESVKSSTSFYYKSLHSHVSFWYSAIIPFRYTTNYTKHIILFRKSTRKPKCISSLVVFFLMQLIYFLKGGDTRFRQIVEYETCYYLYIYKWNYSNWSC